MPEMKDRLLRTLAEMENLRKRTEREVADSRLYGVTSFARDVLGVADNMRRALEAVAPELRASAQSGAKALVDGVELTERELLKALEKNGVRQFTPQGEKFDPNLHQAMFEVPDATVPAGSVVAGGAARLHDRRAGAAPGAGRGVEGRTENGAGFAHQRQRQSTRRTRTRNPIHLGLDAVAYRAQPRQHVGPMIGVRDADHLHVIRRCRSAAIARP